MGPEKNWKHLSQSLGETESSGEERGEVGTGTVTVTVTVQTDSLRVPPPPGVTVQLFIGLTLCLSWPSALEVSSREIRNTKLVWVSS